MAVVITTEEREQAQAVLEQIEQVTGKGTRKWQRTAFAQRLAYLRAVLGTLLFHGTIFFASYARTHAYRDLTVDATAKAIRHKAKDMEGGYETTVLVDGLDRKQERHMGTGLRRARLKIKKVKGVRDESDPLIRLADAIAGFVRDALEGQDYVQALYQDAITNGIIHAV